MKPPAVIPSIAIASSGSRALATPTAWTLAAISFGEKASKPNTSIWHLAEDSDHGPGSAARDTARCYRYPRTGILEEAVQHARPTPGRGAVQITHNPLQPFLTARRRSLRTPRARASS